MGAGALRIGLTGGIGSGKSTAAAALQALGATLVDTDAIARELTGPGGAALPALKARFGTDCIDAAGALDRPWMRRRAFDDPAVRQTLEAILHPLIGAEAARRAALATLPCIVFDVPLLVETGHWRPRVDRVLVIDCHEATQLRRVLLRPGWAQPDAQRVIASQASRAVRRAAADAVIDNDTDAIEPLRQHIAALWDAWLGRR
jgi:dephospho-CoA kinase